MIKYASSLRYVKQDVKTTIVDKWVSMKWQTLKNARLKAAFATENYKTAGALIGKVLLFSGKRRVWFTTVYLIFDLYTIDRPGDTHVLGVMAEDDFLARVLGTSLPPTIYQGIDPYLDIAFGSILCKKHIKVF